MKYIRLFIVAFFSFLILPKCCFASTNTYQRTREKLLIPNDVVAGNNINDILNTPAVSSDEKIYDFAELLSDNQEKKLLNKINDFMNNSEMDTAFVTTNDLNGFSLSDYAYHFYDYNDFKDNGVIFVIYMDEAEPRIFMGNGGKASTIYTDSIIKQTLGYVYKNISVKNYYQAVDDYYTILNGFYDRSQGEKKEYKIGSNGDFVVAVPWLEIIILSLSLTFMIVFLLISIMKKKIQKKHGDILDKRLDMTTLIVKTEHDQYVDTSTS